MDADDFEQNALRLFFEWMQVGVSAEEAWSNVVAAYRPLTLPTPTGDPELDAEIRRATEAVVTAAKLTVSTEPALWLGRFLMWQEATRHRDKLLAIQEQLRHRAGGRVRCARCSAKNATSDRQYCRFHGGPV